MNTWPWDSFPEDMSTWEHCVKQYAALKERCEAVEKVVEAARNLCESHWGLLESAGLYGFRDSPHKLIEALAELERE